MIWNNEKPPQMPNIDLTKEQIKTKNNLLSKPVNQFIMGEQSDVSTLISSYKNSSFQARNLGEASELYLSKSHDDLSIIWSLSGSLFGAGMHQVAVDAIKNNLVDIIVCTGALIEQDMLFALGHTHYKCTPNINDGDLQTLGIDRVYDHLVDEMAMQQVDLTFKQIADDLPPGRYSSRTFLQKVGQWLSDCNFGHESILQIAYEKNLPIFSPALNDSSVGIGLVLHQGEKQLSDTLGIDSILDFKEIANLKASCGDTGLFIVGGGTPKNYSQDIVVMSEMLGNEPKRHLFGIQLSVADVRDGGLSGSTLQEAVSWGKNDPKIEDIMVWGEASISFPLLVTYVYQGRLQNLRKAQHLTKNLD
tara:strand:- start:186 stop:1268 length:1083 start_codon:yes stop_codon:yes gene_type:complete